MTQNDLKPVLTWVNQEREKRGLEPLERLPKGRRRFEDDCSMARALPPGGDYDFDDLPRTIRRFIEDFDNGKYPELVA